MAFLKYCGKGRRSWFSAFFFLSYSVINLPICQCSSFWAVALKGYSFQNNYLPFMKLFTTQPGLLTTLRNMPFKSIGGGGGVE